MEEERIGDMLKGLKYTSLEFPCGLKIEMSKELFKDFKKLTCPLHGKKCVSFSIRKFQGKIDK